MPKPLDHRRRGNARSRIRRWLFAVCVLLAPAAARAQVSLYTVVDLAMRNSSSVRMSVADVERAAAGLAESRKVYIPNLFFSSSLGYSYGFPLGEPSIFNLQTQSLVFNFSQKDYIRSASSALRATELQLKDVRQQVALDVALDYIQLDTLTHQLAAMDEEVAAADRLIAIEQQRVDSGLESRTDMLRSRLTAAQVRLKRLHGQQDADLLRDKLADLTGLPVSTIVTSTASIPTAPQIDLTRFESVAQAASGNQSVLAAVAAAESKTYVSFGDSRQNFRPQISFGAQYSRFSSFNNYDEFYRNFQANNLSIGFNILVPFFDVSRTAKAQESKADAIHATAQADQVREQVGEQAMQLRHSLAELAAQQQVAELQSELAQSELEAVVAQLQSGSGRPGGTPLSPRDEQAARIEERQRYEQMLDADFQLMRAQLGLLRSTGTLEEWLKNVTPTKP